MSEPSKDPHKDLDALLVYIEAAALPCVFSRRPQLGLYYLAQHATDAGFKVAVDNLSSNDHLIRRIVRVLKEHSCRILGFYVDQDNLWVIRRITPELISQLPDLQIILGGPQMTADPEVTLARLPEALCGVIGEGEETLVDLLALPQRTPQTLKSCRGLAFHTDNGVFFTEPRQAIDPLDKLSMPQRLELTLDETNVAPIMITGRGCSGRCAFCFEGGQKGPGKRLRLHSVDRTLAEFDYLVQASGNSYISIVDDTFVTSIKRLQEFCRALISRYQGKVKWFCESRVDILARHPELMPIMIEAGLIRVQVGGESGSQRILDIYRKGTTLEQMYQVVENAKKCGLLSLFANFIVGGAFETRQTFNQTLEFALELLNLAPGCMAIGSSFYTPYPGTPMYENPQDFGIQVNDTEVVTGMGDHHAFCRTAELSRFDILALKAEFDSKIKERMKELALQLPQEEIKRQFQAFYDWKLSTEWHDIIAENELWHLYYKSVISSGARSFAEITLPEQKDAYPMRNIDPVATKECNYLVRTPRGAVRELDTLESMILDLSAGKLCFDDILMMLRSHFPELPSDSLEQAIIDRYHSLDRDCLVVWRTNNF